MGPAREPRLQRQLLGWLLGPLLVLLVLDAGVSYWTAWNYSNLAHDRSLHEIAREIALQVKAEGGAPRLDMSPAAERILLNDADDKLYFRVALSPATMLGGDPAFPAPGAWPGETAPPRFYDAQIGGQAVRAVATWLPYDAAQPQRRVLVQVAETLGKRTALARDIIFSAVAPQLLLIVLATVAVYFGVTRGLRPLRRLEAAVSDRSHRHLSPLDTAGVPAEVRPLVEEVNELMARLGTALDLQTRFVTDAAHQLKTPVSGLKAQIELALREEDPERIRHALAQVYVSTDRLSRLVRQLLSLARNEPGAAAAFQREPLDLRALALDVSMEWVPQALQKGVDLGFEGTEEAIMLDGDADRLRELINNLIDNAIRYSARGGQVTVSLAIAPGGADAVLSVSDDSTRIPVEERSRIFERFHRLLGTQTDGSGLGLAIVSEIASLHGARIELEDDHDGIGNRFNVHFPVARLAAAPAHAPTL